MNTASDMQTLDRLLELLEMEQNGPLLAEEFEELETLSKKHPELALGCMQGTALTSSVTTTAVSLLESQVPINRSQWIWGSPNQ